MTVINSRGPWSIGSNGATAKVVDADGKAVCMVTPRKGQWNAALIAAAPELREYAAALLERMNALDAILSSDISSDIALRKIVEARAEIYAALELAIPEELMS